MDVESLDQSDTNFGAYIIQKLEDELPIIFARSEIARLLGGTITAGTLANLGKNGLTYVLIGNKAIYERSSFLEWIEHQMKNA